MTKIPITKDVLWQGDKWLYMMEQTGLWTLQTTQQQPKGKKKKINFRYGIELMRCIDWTEGQSLP